MGELAFTIRELAPEDAVFSYPVSVVSDHEPIPANPGIIGQPRALRALSMGMAIDSAGYNIFVSGDPGTGRQSAVLQVAQPLRGDTGKLRDIAYVHNFLKPDSPVVLTFSPGDGAEFASAMKTFTFRLQQKIMNLVSGKQPDTPIDPEELADASWTLLEPIAHRFDAISCVNHLRHIKNDIRDHAYLFGMMDAEQVKNSDIFYRYGVNLLINHADTASRPLIVESHPTFSNLFGSVDPNTDVHDDRHLPYLSIHAGSLLEAAGGFMVINAEEMLAEEGLWDSLKRFLDTGSLVIQNSSNGISANRTSGIRPQPAPLSVKIILIGSETTYDKFCEHDEQFLKLFKVSAEFDFAMPANKENIAGTIGFIRRTVAKERLLPVSDDAIAELLRYSSWYAEQRNELTTQLSFVSDLLQEADYWARQSDANIIDRTKVVRAMDERDYVSGITESRINSEIAAGEMIIMLKGTKTGMVNGLAVMDRGAASFGTPTVISATVAPGSEGIVNIEHEAGLSGEIHDKGLLILEGYLRKRYARSFPLSIYAGICFEQSYAEVDGDSASSSELFALLSAIGEIPVRQDIAVTGSVNQMGEIQPVGGINEKISGFYKICAKMGLTKHQGVIIPKQNINSLILPYDVLDAIERHAFHLYPIETVDEGMQILTNRPAGVRNAKGNFPVDTLNRAIEDRLRKLYELSRPNS